MPRSFSIDTFLSPSLKYFFIAGFQYPLIREPSWSTILKTNVALIIFLLSWSILKFFNQRLAFGAPRQIHWDEELVVVTGGSRGLGAEIVRLLAAKGRRVAVLDIIPPEDRHEEHGPVKFYHCDVSDSEAIERAAEMIRKDLGQPTILINNAGIVNGKPLVDLSMSEIERNFRINLLPHYATIQAFLPGMLASPQGGTVVTVASVLGHLGAAQLSDYAASKAGLLAMHASFAAEMAALAQTSDAPGAGKIRTLLVKPGQLSSELFASMPTPSGFFGPVVDVRELAAEIVKRLESGASGVLGMPLYTRWVEVMFVLPYGVQAVLRRVSGVDRAMRHFKPKTG